MGIRWPLRRRRFPRALRAVVQVTVLEGKELVRDVLHDEEGYWLLGDGVNDPNVEGACVLAHMGHILERNPHLHELVDMPRGTQAEWCGEHWHRRPLEYLPDEEPFAPMEWPDK